MYNLQIETQNIASLFVIDYVLVQIKIVRRT
jgi:hypothetical protein